MTSFGEDLRKLLLMGIGAVAVTAEKSKEVVDELVKKGELTVEQGKVLNEELKRNIKDKIKDNVIVNVVKAEPTADAVVENLDKMSKEDIEAIKAKLAEMEKAEEQHGEAENAAE